MKNSIREIPSDAWDALVAPNNPFFSHQFLSNLEISQSVGINSTWEPEYFLEYENNRLAGAIPSYVKTDSYGEFVFDWSWANAYHRNGIPYYPKRVVSVPFMPIISQKILGASDSIKNNLISSLVEHSKDMSSLHILFPTQEEVLLLREQNFIIRHGIQYHWSNRGYVTFDDFLSDIHRKKRQQMRKERAEIAKQGIEVERLTGSAIKPEHCEAMWRFYYKTFTQHGNEPYLDKPFFDLCYQNMNQNMLLVMAKKDSGYIGGALCYLKGDTLYGRYWGCSEFYSSLHFECCYYQLIEHAIENKIQIVQPGADGEHKFLRGFAPTLTNSAHTIFHPGFRTAIEKFVAQESKEVFRLKAEYDALSPLLYLRNK